MSRVAVSSSVPLPRRDRVLFPHEGDPIASRLLPRSWVFWLPAAFWLAWTILIDVGVGAWRHLLFSVDQFQGLFGEPDHVLVDADWSGLLGDFVVLPLLVGYYFWTPVALIRALRRLEHESVLTITEADVKWWRDFFRPAAWVIAPLAVVFGFWVMTTFIGLQNKLWLGDPVLARIKLVFFWIPLSYMTTMFLYRIACLVWLLGRVFGPNRKIVIKPLHPDGAGGLEPLAGFALKLTFFLGLGGAELILIEQSSNFAHELSGTAGALPTYIIGAVFVVFGLGAFFAPLVAPHDRMRHAKEGLLARLSERYQKLEEDRLSRLEELDDTEFAAATREIESMHKMQELVRSFPVWPFETQILLRLGIFALGQPLTAAAVTSLLHR